MNDKCFIYVLKNPTNNKIRYVGKSRNLKQRFKNHINKGRDKNTHKRNWINKLMKDNLTPNMEVIEETNNDNWKEREKYWIKYYTDKGCKLVNHTEGGDGLTFGNQTSFKRGQNSKEIISLTKDGIHHKIFPSIKDAENFHKLSTGTISHVLKKNRKTSCNLIWLYKTHYDNMNTNDISEHIKWALRNDSSVNKTSYKPVEIYQYDTNGIFIKKWKSLSSVEKNLKINKSAICNCAKGKTKTSGGYMWNYKKIK